MASIQPSSNVHPSMGRVPSVNIEIMNTVGSTDTTILDPLLPSFSARIPERLYFFQGRQDIFDVIDKALLPPSLNTTDGDNIEDKEASGLRAFALCGLGGIGKTETAIEYAYRRRDVFEAVFWVRSGDRHVLAEEFLHIAEQMGFDHSSHDSVVNLNFIQSWLDEPVRKRKREDIDRSAEVHWLLIFDGVVDFDALFDYWPRNGKGSVLMTSRNTTWTSDLTPMKRLVLESLTPRDSVELLQDVAYLITDDTDNGALSAITERLGGIPLAIAQAGSIIARQGLTYAEFLELYKAQGVNGLQNGQPTTIRGQSLSLCEVWTADLPPSGKALLDVISLLDPHDIPELLIRQNLNRPKLEDYPGNDSQYRNAIWPLLSRNLVDHDLNTGVMWIHPLVQDVVQASMGDKRLAKFVSLAVSLFKSAGFPRSSVEPERLLPSFFRVQHQVFQLISKPSSFVVDTELYLLFSEVSKYVPFFVLYSEIIYLYQQLPTRQRDC